MNLYDKLYNMDSLYGIWHYTNQIRITFVRKGWLIIWDHHESPPTRYDCEAIDHHEACVAAVEQLRVMTGS